MNYLPGVEAGARRLIGRSSGEQESSSWRDGLTGARILGGRSEKMGADLEPGNIASLLASSSQLMLIIAFPKQYTFQLALTNPLLDSISVTLRPLHTSLFGAVHEPERYFDVWFPVDRVHVGAFGEAGDEPTNKIQGRAVSSSDAELVDEGESMTKIRFCVVLHDRLKEHLQDGKKLKLGVSVFV
jgi:hypothetical protein